ncbi:hypothetical protein Val02_24250 [Virgisporangium aliadipatigenens]|uniref:Glutamate mutase n=1 Tax=Virgisporangium aliadipatigenens TaxID=741659 RepID=A0A8J3YHT6_9ACTN|nr:hypothetical protein Val02_24250 [Virgisporangium aliadipatigenens]
MDVGSTFTKAAIVDLDAGELVATGAHRTTVDGDVLDGLDAAVAATGHTPERILACSSAGGGLRLAVVGYEPLVSAQAGHRVALSAGARVVHVHGGSLDGAALSALRAARPDVVLLVGGTDGGDAETLLHNAGRLGRARWRGPVVLAGNADARDDAVAALAGVPVTACANVLPHIGELNPTPARDAIRAVFLRHVIGGKRLSRGPRFAELVRAPTPDAVLTGVELLADHLAGDLLVVDVGGATTDVYSALVPDGAVHEVAGVSWRSRTVEGDLGVRWSAPSLLEAARAERLEADDRSRKHPDPRPTGASATGRPGASTGAAGQEGTGGLDEAAAARGAEPGLPGDPAVDLPLAGLAATVALRRHARGESVRVAGVEARRGGRDLRDVVLVVGSGGVLRHADPAAARAVLAAAVSDTAGGWALPRSPEIVIDTDYVLAPAGLLAAEHPRAAISLLRRHLHVQ